VGSGHGEPKSAIVASPVQAGPYLSAKSGIEYSHGHVGIGNVDVDATQSEALCEWKKVIVPRIGPNLVEVDHGEMENTRPPGQFGIDSDVQSRLGHFVGRVVSSVSSTDASCLSVWHGTVYEPETNGTTDTRNDNDDDDDDDDDCFGSRQTNEPQINSNDCTN
jgi:hypothetical protein